MSQGESSGKPVSKPVKGAHQHPGLTDEAIEKVRGLIGVWLRRDVHAPARYEAIAPGDIRRWAQYAVGDDNPLWCDSEYAKRTMWGGIIAPPSFLGTVDSGLVAPGLPGIQWIYAGSRWEHHFPVRVGDVVSARARLIDVQVKEGRNVPRFVNQVGEVLYTNQNNQLVARYEGDYFRIPRARSGGGIKKSTEPRTPYRYTDEQIEEIAQAYRNEERRGAEPRYWEDVKIGDELPTLWKGPLTLVDIVGFYVGRQTTYSVLRSAFLDRDRHPANVYTSPTRNIPVHPAAGHFDAEIAREIGMPDVYDQAWQRINWGGHLVTNWMGDMGFVRRLSGRITKPNFLGDLTKMNGKVTDCRKEANEALVDIEWWGTNQKDQRTCDGKATVRLPSRDISIQVL